MYETIFLFPWLLATELSWVQACNTKLPSGLLPCLLLPAFPALPRHFAMQIQLNGLTSKQWKLLISFLLGQLPAPRESEPAQQLEKRGIWSKPVPLVSRAPPVTWSCVLSTLPLGRSPRQSWCQGPFWGCCVQKRGWNADIATHCLCFFLSQVWLGWSKSRNMKFTES